MISLPTTSTPVVLPHFQRRGRGVYFLIDRRPVTTLSASETVLFDSIDGMLSIRDLSREHKAAPAVVARWKAKGILCLIPKTDRPMDGPHVVIVEPHMDDALLSLCGSLLRRRHVRITILSMVRWSTCTSYEYVGRYEFSDVDRVSELRLAESRLAARSIGANHAVLEEYDGPLLAYTDANGVVSRQAVRMRIHESRRGIESRRDRWVAEQALGIWPDDTARLASEFRRAFESLKPDELWVPMGIGHFDHVRARRGCLSCMMLDPGRFERCKIYLYADVPYCGRYPDVSAAIEESLIAAGVKLERFTEDISSEYDRKMEILGVYASQWKIAHMMSQIPTTEAFVRVTSLPSRDS